MTVAEFESLKALLEPVLGRDRPIEPGTSFGTVIAKVRGQVGDFAWSTDFSPYVKESVFKEMQEAGFPIAGAKAQLTFKRDPGEPLFQLEMRPTARLAPSVEYKLCNVCGRTEVYRKKIVDYASFDGSIPIQLVYEIPTLLVVNESFAKFIRAKKYSGVRLTVQESE